MRRGRGEGALDRIFAAPASGVAEARADLVAVVHELADHVPAGVAGDALRRGAHQGQPTGHRRTSSDEHLHHAAPAAKPQSAQVAKDRDRQRMMLKQKMEEGLSKQIFEHLISYISIHLTDLSGLKSIRLLKELF